MDINTKSTSEEHIQECSPETPATETCPTEAAPSETTPAETCPTEAAPAEATPAETCPTETTPTETCPTETAPAEITPAETCTAETAPAETTPAETCQAETTTTPAEASSEESWDVFITIEEDKITHSAAESAAQKASADETENARSSTASGDDADNPSESTEGDEKGDKESVMLNAADTEEPETTPVSDSSEPVFPPLPLPDPIADYRGGISAFGFSQQGESHLKKDTPCQDRSSVRFISDSVVIAAVADGVGSCVLSDYGADAAVTSSLNYLEDQLAPKLEDPSFTLDVPLMGKVLREMMQVAFDKVQSRAEEMQQLLYSLQSTLTVAVFDGKTLFFAHAGDDGIVAVTRDGKCEMVTTRHKGEEASSVYPLQSRNTWQYGKVDNVVGFVMATDGVLDAFVRNETEGNRVYYPFIEPTFSARLSSKEETLSTCNDWQTYMKSPQYRTSVTDDLSFVCVINQDTLKTAQKPDFDMAEWNKKSREYEERRRAALYPPKSQQPKPASAQPDNTGNGPFSARPPQQSAPIYTQRKTPGNTTPPPSNTTSSFRSTATPPYGTPVPPNADPYSDNAKARELLKAGKKVFDDLSDFVLVGSEIFFDASSNAIRAVRNKRKENADARRDNQQQNQTPDYPGSPKPGNNGNGGSTNGT